MNRSSVKIFSGLLLSALVFAGRSSLAMPQDTARVPEGVVRKAAITTVKPEYPAASRKRQTQGLAVVLVEIDERGAVTSVKVLEAPDGEIGESVVRAVKQWRFGPLAADGRPVKVQGKLTFYFSIRDGKARVDDPKRFSRHENE